MNPDDATPSPTTDHGEVVSSQKRSPFWVWIFPILAAAAAGWFFFEEIESRGPTIEVHFGETPGIFERKTKLTYRGVESGTVESVTLDKELGSVVVKISLKKFAAGLATRETIFWIDRPVFNLAEMTGIETIVAGNSIQASSPGGPPCLVFRGKSKPPLVPIKPGAFIVKLEGANLPFLNTGASVYHRGIKTGSVHSKRLDSEGKAIIELSIDPEFRSTIRTTSRFWSLAASRFTLGQHGVEIAIDGLEALVQGAVAYDHFERDGMEASSNLVFPIMPTEFSARCSGTPLSVSFMDGRGLIPGQSTVNYLGQPVGIVESIAKDPLSEKLNTIIRLEPSAENLARTDSIFRIVRPTISLDRVAGLDTLLTGAYIDLDLGTSETLATTFLGISSDKETAEAVFEGGLLISLHADDLPGLGKGTPLLHKGIVVGTVLEKTLNESGSPILKAVIAHAYRDHVSDKTRFWRFAATTVKAGPGVLELEVENLKTLIHGGIAFDAFGENGPPTQQGSEFRLYKTESAAKAVSPPVRIQLKSGRGLAAWRTEVRYLGLPVGLVEKVEPKDGAVIATVRFDKGHEDLRRKGSVFSVVRPNISLQGITGLETLISGVYIECIPGESTSTTDFFVGRSTFESDQILQGGLTLKLTSPETPISAGASIFYRGITIGRVVEKNLTPDAQGIILTVVIDKEYAHLARANSRFWNSSGLKASLGFLKFNIDAESVVSTVGRISMATPDSTELAPKAKTGDTFELHTSPEPAWLKWNPAVRRN